MGMRNGADGVTWGSVAREIRTASIVTMTLALLLCGLYPLLVWGLAQSFFPWKANGSLIVQNERVVGSRLMGQTFTSPTYFHSRPSAAGEGYDASRSGGSNLGPISRSLINTVEERIRRYRTENDLPPTTPVPADGVTASASGLDPHISVRNALLQARRVAAARGRSEESMIRLIREATEGRDMGILGEPRVNVLLLNLALDSDR